MRQIENQIFRPLAKGGKLKILTIVAERRIGKDFINDDSQADL